MKMQQKNEIQNKKKRFKKRETDVWLNFTIYNYQTVINNNNNNNQDNKISIKKNLHSSLPYLSFSLSFNKELSY
jgi:hypothetical protein